MASPDIQRLRDEERELERRLKDANEKRKDEIKARLQQVRGRIQTLQGGVKQSQGGEGGASPEQKAREKAREEAQKTKDRSLKDASQQFINLVISMDLNPNDYRDEIEKAAKNGWGTDTFLKRAGLEDEFLGAKETEQFLTGILSDYEQAYGKPADAELIKQLQRLSKDQLAVYNQQLQGILEQKDQRAQTKGTYLAQLTARYMEMWGVPPPPNYIEDIAKQGKNIYEFESMERNKPEFENSPLFHREYQDVGSGLLSRLGLV